MGTEYDLKIRYSLYKQAMYDCFWSYQRKHYKHKDILFEKTYEENSKRPPVFRREHGYENVLVKSDQAQEVNDLVTGQLPEGKWHKWFASMSSSQALAPSVFGNLSVLKKISCLAGLKGDDGKPLFIRGQESLNLKRLELEKVILYLGETSRKTNVDVSFGGPHQVAVECKLMERELGPCSGPRMRRNETNYDTEFCDGRYCRQEKRTERCSLTEIGVKYWQHIPELFDWDPYVDHDACPLNRTYQLVRNVLAAVLRPKGGDETEPVASDGHAVLLYDERNPQFRAGGEGWRAFENTKKGLKNPTLLQSCTWQQVIGAMKQDPELDWLVGALNQKYGLKPSDE